jgi:hypothetical protein
MAANQEHVRVELTAVGRLAVPADSVNSWRGLEEAGGGWCDGQGGYCQQDSTDLDGVSAGLRS